MSILLSKSLLLTDLLPATVGSSRYFNKEEVEQIKQKTASLQTLFELHHHCLPLSLYYTYPPSSLEYIETEKFLQDHIHGVAMGIPKYSVDELDVISARLKCQLNGLGCQIGRFPVRDVFYHVNVRDISSLGEFAWQYFE